MDEGAYNTNLVEFALETLRLMTKNSIGWPINSAKLFDCAVKWGLAEYDSEGKFKIKDCTF